MAAAVFLGLAALGACDADRGTDGATAVRADTAAAARAPAGGACALVPEAAIEEAVGLDVVMTDSRTGNCVLTPASGDPGAPAFDFRLEPRPNAFDYFSAQPDATPVAGLGDRAVRATVNDMTGYVVVVRGEEAIVVAVAEADGLSPSSHQRAERLARLLLTETTAH